MKEFNGQLNASNRKFAIVLSRFNDLIGNRLLSGAVDCIERHGGNTDELTLVRLPGAFEIPAAANKLATSGKYEAVVCLGAVIRGGTPHFEYVSAEMTKGIASVSLQAGLPIAFGVLTTDSVEQAIERAGTKAGNKGVEAAMSAIEMVNLLGTV